SHRTDVRPSLIGALAREQDAAAGAEMIRDLLVLSGAADVPTVEPQVRRFGAQAVLTFAEWLAREQPADFAARLGDLSMQAAPLLRDLRPILTTAPPPHP